MIQSGRRTETVHVPALPLALAIVAVAALALTVLVSFVLYHTLAETVYIAIGTAVFLSAWLLRDFTDDDLPMFLGIALFATAILHLAHAVDYPGVDMVTTSPDAPAQLWVATALLLAASFAAAPAVIGHRLPVRGVLMGYLAADAVILMAVYWWHILPVALTPYGYTGFDVAGECLAIGLFAVAILGFRRRRALLPPAAFPLLVLALLANAAAELTGTLYRGPRVWPTTMAHILLDVSTVLIYTAVAQASIAWPHATRVSNLVRSERTARADRRQEQAIRRALDRLLQLSLSVRADEGFAEAAWTACASACELFRCDHAMLFEVREENLELTAISPEHPNVPLRSRFSIADDPDLMERLHTRIPSFKAETSDRTLGPGIASLAARLHQASVLRAPIGTGEIADRLLVLGWEAPREEPDALMRALLQRFGDQVAAILANVRSRELQAEASELHEQFETSLRPRLPQRCAGLRIYAHNSQGEGRLGLGGDFLDIYDGGERGLSLIVGDVSGHGPRAAALGATLRAGWRALESLGVGPEPLVMSLHQIVEDARADPDDGTFATLCLAWIDAGRRTLRLLNMGHPPPLLIVSGVARIEIAPLPPLGTFPPKYEKPAVLPLPAGGHLFFYTDGLIEGFAMPGSKERYGERRLIEALGTMTVGPLDAERVDRLIRTIETSGGDHRRFADDVSVVVISMDAA